MNIFLKLRTVVVLLLFFFLASTIISCGHSNNSDKNPNFIYGYRAKLVEKYHEGTSNIFVIQDIKDSTINFFWRVDLNTYVKRNVGDYVYFQYINKNKLEK